MLRRPLALVMFIALTACGGGASTPTSPTTTPPPPPPPQFSNMLGVWRGTLTIVAEAGSVRNSNVCSTTWTLTSQTGGDFSGTFNTSGGTTTICAQAGTLNGHVELDNRITGVTIDVGGGQNGCSRVAGDGVFAGIMSNGTVSISNDDTLVCDNVTIRRNRSVVMSK